MKSSQSYSGTVNLQERLPLIPNAANTEQKNNKVNRTKTILRKDQQN
jgi:hypothetical protein